MMNFRFVLAILLVVITVGLGLLPTSSATYAEAVPEESVTFRHDLTHSGYVSVDFASNSSKLLWTAETSQPIFSSPTVADGYVFIGSLDGYVYCFNASTGSQVWSFQTHSQIRSSPAISEGRLVVGSDDGSVYCLSTFSGQLLWNVEVGGFVLSSPAIVSSRVYIGSGLHNLFCLSMVDGGIIWRHETANRIDSSPAVSASTVFAAEVDGYVYAIEANSGRELWRHSIQGSKSSPCISGGYIYIGSYNGNAYALNASTGQRAWSFKTQNMVESSPAAAYGCVYVGSDDGSLYCLNASSGQRIWQSSTGYSVLSSPTVAGGCVYVGSEDNCLYCFDASTGAKLWSYETGGYVDSSPAVADGKLYFGSFDCRVYAFSLCNSSSLTIQAASPLTLSTIFFDAAAIAIMIAAVFVGAYVVVHASREKKTPPSAGAHQSWLFRHAEAICVVAILAFSMLFVVNLDGVSFFADEQTYSQWAFHMAKTGDYLTPWAYGTFGVWIAKPPLMMWLMSLAYQAFGASAFASRIWTPMFAAFSLLLVFYFGKKLYSLAVGFVAAVVLGTFITFFLYARSAMTDIPLVCFMLASLYFLILSEESQHRNLHTALGGVFFGLALMTKHFVALFIPAIIAVYWVWSKQSLRFLFTRRFAIFCGIGLLIFAPWVIAMYASFGSNFVQWSLTYTGVMRVATPLEGHVGSPLFYLEFLSTKENPLWVTLLPFAVSLCIFNVVKKKSKADSLLLVWMLLVLGVFSVAQTKIFWYLLPAYPAFALAIASLLYQVSEKIGINKRAKAILQSS